VPKSSEKQPADAGGGAGKRAHDGSPGVVSPSTRVNVALPFSQISLQEPTRELTDLAGVVVDLIAAMSEWVPEERLDDLRARALSIYDCLR